MNNINNNDNSNNNDKKKEMRLNLSVIAVWAVIVAVSGTMLFDGCGKTDEADGGGNYGSVCQRGC